MVVIEIIALISGLVSVYLAGTKSLHTWTTGILSCILLIVVFSQSQMPWMAFMQIIMIVVSVFGLLKWSNKTNYLDTILWSVVAGALLSLMIGMHSVDYIAFAFALCGTTLLSLRRIECWVIFIISNVLTIYELLQFDNYITALQYLLFIILSIKGYILWKKELA